MCVVGWAFLARACSEKFFEDARVVREENVSDGVRSLVNGWEVWKADGGRRRG